MIIEEALFALVYPSCKFYLILSFHNGKFDHFGLTGASVFVIIFTAEVCMSKARRCSDWFFQKQDVMPGRGDSHIKRGMVIISLKGYK